MWLYKLQNKSSVDVEERTLNDLHTRHHYIYFKALKKKITKNTNKTPPKCLQVLELESVLKVKLALFLKAKTSILCLC